MSRNIANNDWFIEKDKYILIIYLVKYQLIHYSGLHTFLILFKETVTWKMNLCGSFFTAIGEELCQR